MHDNIDDLTLLNYRKKAILEDRPAQGFIPNIGQERVFNALDRPAMPFITIFGGGNGVGKTAAMAITVVGFVFGQDELSPFFERYSYIDKVYNSWREGITPKIGRIICHADSMKPGGSVLQALQQWLPKGRYKLNKNGKTYYSEIVFDNGFTLDIKTHDQEKIAHSGTTLAFVLFDEPPPEDTYQEAIGRCRQGGFMCFFLTPLEMAGWMMDQLIDEPDKETAIVYASIWDNCADIPGTRGRLKRENIERMIRQWQRSDPLTVDARVKGHFTHLSGAIYKSFSTEVHGLIPFNLPPGTPITMIMDPHDARPPAVGWIAGTPSRNAILVREWPTDEYTKMGNTSLTLSEVCEELRRIESNLGGVVVDRIMDPNKAEYEYPNTRLTVKAEYAKRGFTFRKGDDNLDVGHRRVQEALAYDYTLPIDERNHPHFYVFNDCNNSIKALKRYGFKKNLNEASSLSSKLDPKYKDFADVIRYGLVGMRKFDTIDSGNSFWDRIKSGR